MQRMSAVTRRKAQRLVHLAAALVLFAYVYLPVGPGVRDVVRFVFFPVLAATGVAMWKAAWIRRMLRRRAGGVAPRRAAE